MAIKITRMGQLPEEKIIEGHCYNCGTEFTFTPKDAKYISDQRDGDFYQVQCPLCKKTCSVNKPSASSYYNK